MKICIVSHEYPPGVLSGPGRYASNLVKVLVKAGHNVTVISPRFMGGKRYEKLGKLEVYRIDIAKSALLDKIVPNVLDVKILFSLALRNFFKVFDLGGYDILHILDMHDTYFLNREIKSVVPILVSVNDYYSLETSWNPLKFPYFCTDFLLRYVHYNITKVMNCKYLKYADLIISDTKYSGRAVNRKVGIPWERIRVVYKGVDREKFTGRVPKGKYSNRRILYVGSNMERKGVVDILKAMPGILERFPDSKLTIIGKASWLYKKRIRNLIVKNRLMDSVEIIDHVSSDRVHEYYNNANVFVLAPVIEDLAQVLLEAMATRTPVVCTNVGANPEAIINNVTGFLVEYGRPEQIARGVIRIFSNPKLARKLGENGKKSVDSVFNADRMLRETMDIYKKLA